MDRLGDRRRIGLFLKSINLTNGDTEWSRDFDREGETVQFDFNIGDGGVHVEALALGAHLGSVSSGVDSQVVNYGSASMWMLDAKGSRIRESGKSITNNSVGLNTVNWAQGSSIDLNKHSYRFTDNVYAIEIEQCSFEFPPVFGAPNKRVEIYIDVIYRQYLDR